MLQPFSVSRELQNQFSLRAALSLSVILASSPENQFHNNIDRLRTILNLRRHYIAVVTV
jgi:hypothetical protein